MDSVKIFGTGVGPTAYAAREKKPVIEPYREAMHFTCAWRTGRENAGRSPSMQNIARKEPFEEPGLIRERNGSRSRENQDGLEHVCRSINCCLRCLALWLVINDGSRFLSEEGEGAICFVVVTKVVSLAPGILGSEASTIAAGIFIKGGRVSQLTLDSFDPSTGSIGGLEANAARDARVTNCVRVSFCNTKR